MNMVSEPEQVVHCTQRQCIVLSYDPTSSEVIASYYRIGHCSLQGVIQPGADKGQTAWV